MKRVILKELAEWKKKTEDRMPLVLYGARQVGKTYILQEFGRDYFKNSIYINFERMPAVAGYFEGDLRPDRLLRLLEEHFGARIVPEDTLLIFDEVQACERALTSLKYFCEEAPEYHIVAAGSLLGVAIRRESYSFPVGKVYVKTMYPMRFDEFLWAMGQEGLEHMIREHFVSMEPMPEAIHSELRLWWLRYLYVGGMPAAVRKYLEEKSLVNVPEVQSLIVNAYTADMAKYASESESTRIRGAYLSLPAQLAKENKKFQYKLIRKGATAGMFGDSIMWLHMAGVAIQSDLATMGELPLAAFRDVSAFKLYLSDVGLLCARANLVPENVLRDELSGVYKGALTENYVAQTLKAAGYELYYWTSDAPAAEVDFVIQINGRVIPVEVKYDTGVRSKSLREFCRRYAPEYALRVSGKNFGEEEGIRSIPLYAAYCI